MKKHINDPIDILGNAYETMYEDTVKEFHHAEEKSKPALHRIIEQAREKVREIEEISQEDANRLADAVERDISDSLRYLSTTGKELKDWLGFETTFLETELFDSLLDVADPTTVKLAQLQLESMPAPVFHTGEITGPGTLVCNHCSEKLHFYKAGKIPPCQTCKGTDFHRHIGIQ